MTIKHIFIGFFIILVNFANAMEITESRTNRSLIAAKNEDDELFKQAIEASDINLEMTQKELTWRGNTGRRNQLVFGIFGVLSGLIKGIYDAIAFSNSEADKTANAFNLVSDLSILAGGGYLIKLSFENGDAQRASKEALILKAILKNTGTIQSQLNEMAKARLE
jgi:hypothetical protein